MNSIGKKYYDWERSLWEEHDSLFPNCMYRITDGVVCPELYSKEALKVLIMNREPYDEECTSYSLNCEGLRYEIENNRVIFEKQKTFRRHMKQILLTVWGFFNHKSLEDIQTIIENSGEEAFSDCIYRSAYVNIKKTDGEKRSRVSDLRNHFINEWPVLRKQIEYFNPSIILSGNIVDGILGSSDSPIVWKEENIYWDGNINVFEFEINGKVYPLFDMFHPSAICFKDRKTGEKAYMDDYYKMLYNVLVDVEKRKPGYWNRRLNLDCFD